MTLRIFQSGNSLALKLPKWLNFKKDSEVKVVQIGKNLIIKPKDESWDEFFDATNEFKSEIKREDLSIQDRNFS